MRTATGKGKNAARDKPTAAGRSTGTAMGTRTLLALQGRRPAERGGSGTGCGIC
ncbi:hypothetical protein OG255_30460 [Streptomyces sp. NBC_01455]|uniref:hypothetical protein n=1 Tax=Streptomyces sp. RPA4-2 TaxID=2721244 RepID=UPI00143EDBA0|nr:MULTISPECIES: hypothetical protein [unclassified Streptomyces]QIY60382.1 hypothetical protein HEP85_30880 [Streptomyces sp. RPA4-2]